MSSSLVSFMRKQLDIRGKSEHTGRGAFWMHARDGVTWDEMVEKIEQLLPKWRKKGLVVEVRDGPDKQNPDDPYRRIEILFSKDRFDPYYRIFYTNERMLEGKWRNGTLLGGVAMCFPDTTSLSK